MCKRPVTRLVPLLMCLGIALMTIAPGSIWVVTARAASQASLPQSRFSSPEEARNALLEAVKSRNFTALGHMFGPVAKELVPGDPVEQQVEFDLFSRLLQERAELTRPGSDRAELVIGAEQWPFPVPLVRRGDEWLFDTAAGREEIISRRIGHNELLAIKACQAYAEAQREYYNLPDPDGEQLPKYAQRLFSTPGRRDGLYWPTSPGQPESPLGPLVARARAEGYFSRSTPVRQSSRAFHGYYFRILKRQGANAPGGAFNYVINNNMVAGHALVAYPAQWGESGVMTFIINQRGRVYQKNLGPRTSRIAAGMRSYNPDLSWKVAQ